MAKMSGETKHEWREKLIDQIRHTGMSIADNAEKIANNYDYMSDDLEVIATFRDQTAPTIEVRQRFIPESYINDRIKKL